MGRFPGEGSGYPLLYFCLENSVDREAWQVTAHGLQRVRHNGATNTDTSCSCSSVQSLSCVWLFVTPWTAAFQASLSNTNSQSLLKLMSIQPYHPLLSPPHAFHLSQLESFPRSQFFASGGQSTGASASASVFPINIQDWFPLGLTGLISLQSKGLSRIFSNTTVHVQTFQKAYWCCFCVKLFIIFSYI